MCVRESESERASERASEREGEREGESERESVHVRLRLMQGNCRAIAGSKKGHMAGLQLLMYGPKKKEEKEDAGFKKGHMAGLTSG